MKTLRNTFIISLLIACTSAVKAQHVGYTYDAAGNRIRREIVMSRQQAPTRSTQTNEEEETYADMVAHRQIKIHPNPTSGILKVEVTELDTDDKCQLLLFNASGQQVISQPATSTVTSLDISSRPCGIYVLRISVNGEETSWKIIKK